jgi:molybdopterin-guanine dinucleotide biosynthesis protein A
LPDDLVERLHQARRKMGAGVPLACARAGDRGPPGVGRWPLALRQDLRRALTVEDLRKIEVWTSRHGVAVADWPAEPIDPFFNVNTPDDAKRAQEMTG